MNDPAFWAAVIAFLTAGAGLLTALRARVEKKKIQAKAVADVEKAELRAQLDKERKEAAEREREAAQRERQAAQEALAYRETLRQEALAAAAALSADVKALGEILSENTRVMERSIELTERIVFSDNFTRDPSLRTRSSDRQGPRRGSRASGRLDRPSNQ